MNWKNLGEKKGGRGQKERMKEKEKRTGPNFEIRSKVW